MFPQISSGFLSPPAVFVLLCLVGALLSLLWRRLGIAVSLIASLCLYALATPALSSAAFADRDQRRQKPHLASHLRRLDESVAGAGFRYPCPVERGPFPDHVRERRRQRAPARGRRHKTRRRRDAGLALAAFPVVV